MKKKNEKEKKEGCRPRQVRTCYTKSELVCLLYAKPKNRWTMHLDILLDRCMLRIGGRFRPPPRYPVDSKLGDQRERKKSDPRP